MLSNQDDLYEMARDVQKNFIITDFEALQIAVQLQRNQILSFANNAGEGNSLESISTSIGGLIEVIADELIPVLKSED